MYTVDIDTGGTMTDGLVSEGGRRYAFKVDTTPHDYTVSFLACLKEAAKMGFTRFIVPRGNMSELKQDDFPDCRIIPVSSIREAITAAFSS